MNLYSMRIAKIDIPKVIVISRRYDYICLQKCHFFTIEIVLPSKNMENQKKVDNQKLKKVNL